MKDILLQVIQCEHCGGNFIETSDGLACASCHSKIALHTQIAIFSAIPDEIRPSEKIERNPNLGTPWRQANWRFLEEQLAFLDDDALILDVGAGRGDFEAALKGRKSLALDVYPYPEVDIVCDLTKVNPFRKNSFDAILLFNVMEHIYDTHALLQSLSAMLKPNGRLIVTIPFMVKMHQVPVDYVRYTHFSLRQLGETHNLAVEHLEGYYDPIFFLGEGLGNLKWRILPTIRGLNHYIGRVLLTAIQILVSLLKRIIGTGWVQPPSEARSLAPTGYQLVYRKQSLIKSAEF